MPADITTNVINNSTHAFQQLKYLIRRHHCETRSYATGGLLKINGVVSGLANPDTISSDATLEFSGPVNSPIIFNATNAILKLDQPSTFTGSISSVVSGDIIDLVGISASSATYSGSTRIRCAYLF